MSGAPVVKLHPTCAVRGVLQVGARFGVCEHYVVGGKCGKSGACSHKQEPDLCSMTVAQLAELVRRDWGAKISPYAAPYLDAMLTLRSVDDNYHLDSGRSMVLYFLSNAGSWRGEVARAVKAELKRRVQ